MKRLLLSLLLIVSLPATARGQTQWGITLPAITTELRLLEVPANGVNYVGLKAPASLAGDVVWTMPTGDGSAGTCLSTNGGAVLSWANCSSGGTGLTSLNGQIGATQSFANVDDTNVTLTIGSAADVHTFTMGWAGTLGAARGGTDQDTSAWSALPLVTAGVWSQYGGTGACGAGTAITELSASGVATCSALGGGNVSTGVTLTSGQLVVGAGTVNIAVGDLSGDVTTSGGTATALSLTGVGAGTYGQVTVDTKGRVTAATTIADVPHGGTGVATLSGLVFGNGVSAMSAYAGTGACPSGQSISELSSIGVATCTAAGAGDVTATGTLTANRLILGAGGTTITAAASLGTTTTVLHGNAGGAPSFGKVVDADLSGQIQVPHGGTGLASGSQGGVPFFDTSTTMASSATLVNHAVVVGGGPGAPRTIGTGTTGQVLISQGASVDPTWSAASGCIVAGSNGQLQFNSSGLCGADAALTWDNTNKRLGLGTAAPVTQLQVTGDLTMLGATWAAAAPRILATEPGSTALGISGWQPYVTFKLNNLANPIKTAIYIEDFNTDSGATGRTNSGIAIFHASKQDNGHEVSGIVSTEYLDGNGGTFQRICNGSRPGGIPACSLSRQFGFALEVNATDNTTAAIFGGGDTGLTIGAGVGNGVGPPWPEGIRIYPKIDAANLASRIGLIVTENQDDLNQTTNFGFKVMMNGKTEIQNNLGINDHLTIVGTGAQGANIFMLGDGGTTPQKFLRVSGGDFQILNSAYSSAVLSLSDVSHLGLGGNYDSATGMVLTLTDTGANGSNIELVGDNFGSTPKKFLRSRAGQFEILNNAYNAALLTLTDAGQLTSPQVASTGNVTLLGSNAQQVALKRQTQLVSVASGVTTQATTIQIPADAVIWAVPVRVTAQPGGTSTMTVTATTSGTVFQKGASISTAANTIDPGTKNVPTSYNGVAAQTVTFTFNAPTSDALGRIRVDIIYLESTPPTS